MSKSQTFTFPSREMVTEEFASANLPLTKLDPNYIADLSQELLVGLFNKLWKSKKHIFATYYQLSLGNLCAYLKGKKTSPYCRLALCDYISHPFRSFPGESPLREMADDFSDVKALLSNVASTILFIDGRCLVPLLIKGLGQSLRVREGKMIPLIYIEKDSFSLGEIDDYLCQTAGVSLEQLVKMNVLFRHTKTSTSESVCPRIATDITFLHYMLPQTVGDDQRPLKFTYVVNHEYIQEVLAYSFDRKVIYINGGERGLAAAIDFEDSLMNKCTLDELIDQLATRPDQREDFLLEALLDRPISLYYEAVRRLTSEVSWPVEIQDDLLRAMWRMKWKDKREKFYEFVWDKLMLPLERGDSNPVKTRNELVSEFNRYLGQKRTPKDTAREMMKRYVAL
jgi:hypothetical protein